MFIFTLLSWWYSSGLKTRLQGLGGALSRTADNFSIGLLFRTLFSPFRQIDAGATGKGPEAAFQAFLSRLISRAVGFVARTVLIVAGIVTLIFQAAASTIIILLHILTPLAPIVGIVLALNLPEVQLW